VRDAGKYSLPNGSISTWKKANWSLRSAKQANAA